MRQTDFTLVNQIITKPENAVVLVGAALDGPSNTPFSLTIDAEPHQVLGECSLADAYVAARRVGISTIVAYRINGVHSTASLVDKNGVAVMEFRSIGGAESYNDIQMIAYPDHLFVVNTDGVSRSYYFDKYQKVNDLAYAINRDSYYGLIEFNAAVISDYYSLMNVVDFATEVSFTSGTSESHLVNVRDPKSTGHTDIAVTVPILKDRLNMALFGDNPDDIEDRIPNSDLGAMNFGVIVLSDMFHDDYQLDELGNQVNLGLTEVLASFCMNKTKEIGFGCVGVIGTRPIYENVIDPGDDEYGDMAEVEDYDVTVHNRVLDLVSLSESLEDLEAYKYVQVIVGHTEYPESNESSISMAYGYAAAQAYLPYYTMMSNKGIGGVGKLNFALTKEDVALLTSNGYTCIVPSIRRGFVPYYASSFSKDKESLASKPHNLRISQYVSHMLVEEVDGFIGESYAKLSIKDTIAKAKELLDGLIVDGVIRNHTIDYELLENNTVLNINTSLTPFSELKSIGSVAMISFPQGGVE
jgi:hypothetical protein